MPFFDDLFMESKGKPIIYRGNTLVMSDILPVQDGEKLRFSFESIGSDWRQGVGLATNIRMKTKGYFTFLDNGEKIRSPIVFWRDTAPDVVEFIVNTKDRQLKVHSLWDNGDGTINPSGSAGGAMIVEEIPKGRRYRCNDGHPDENFDDIIFRIERIDEPK